MRKERLELVLFVLSVVMAGLLLLHFRHFYHDDACITLRYVSRLLAGKGLTWNDGERVEGFTHPLWLAQVAALGALGVPLLAATRLLGLLYLIALFVLWWRSRARGWVLLLTATQPGLLLWTLGGLETVSLCFFLALGLYAWWPFLPGSRGRDHAETGLEGDRARRAPATGASACLGGAAFAAAALTRPEGIAVGLLAMLALLWARRLPRASLRGALAVLLLPIVAYTVFRLTYFHDLLATSARAKLDGVPIGTRIGSAMEYFGRTAGLWAPAAVALTALLAATRVRKGWIAAGLGLPLCAGALVGGGDHMPGARLLVPPLVLAAYGTALAMRPQYSARKGHGAPERRERIEPLRGREGIVLAALVVAASAMQIRGALHIPGSRDTAVEVGTLVGRYLEQKLPPGALVAASTAGSVPFQAPSLRFIDMLGLNDPVIARRPVSSFLTNWQHRPGHWKGDGAYVLSRRPDVIILGPAQGFLGDNPGAWFLSDYELLMNPSFRSSYAPYGFLAPVDAESTADPALQPILTPDRKWLVLVAYLRNDSGPALALARQGRKLDPPWAAVRGVPGSR
jgi:arabinofuranosyltransferase